MAQITAIILRLGILQTLLWGSAIGWTGDTLLVEQRSFGAFENATRLLVDSHKKIYIIDEARHLISVLDGIDGPPQTLGGYGWDETTFDKPTAVATDGLSVFVADHGNHRINRYDRRLVFLWSLSTRDTSHAPARFGYPLGIALSRQGDLFVLDGENTRVVKFDSRFGFTKSFGDLESAAGRLQHPIKMLINRYDDIMVLEPDQIIVFDYVGNYARTIGKGDFSEARGFCETQGGVLIVTRDRLLWYDNDGNLSSSVYTSTIISQIPLVSVSDVALLDDMILILTSKSVGVFRVVN